MNIIIICGRIKINILICHKSTFFRALFDEKDYICILCESEHKRKRQ